jgi:hypothetical protein
MRMIFAPWKGESVKERGGGRLGGFVLSSVTSFLRTSLTLSPNDA